MAQLSKSPKKSLEAIQFQGSSQIGGYAAAKGTNPGNLGNGSIANLETPIIRSPSKPQMPSTCKYINCYS